MSDYNEVDQDNLSVLGEVDTILLGRETHRLFVEYWPTAEDEPVADAVNSTPKIVFSSTLDSAPWGGWKPAGAERQRRRPRAPAPAQAEPTSLA